MDRRIAGGSYQVGTRDGVKVYLDRFTGLSGTGERVLFLEMPPDEARQIGQALIDQADEIELTRRRLYPTNQETP